MTGIFKARRNLAVPPVEMISTPKRSRPWANGANPALSETEMRARLTLITSKGLSFAFFALTLGGLAIETAFLQFNEKTILLALLLELPHGLLETVLV